MHDASTGCLSVECIDVCVSTAHSRIELKRVAFLADRAGTFLDDNRIQKHPPSPSPPSPFAPLFFHFSFSLVSSSPVTASPTSLNTPLPAMRPFALVVTLSALVAAAPMVRPGDCKENIPDWVCKTWNLNCCNSAAHEGDRLPDSNPYSSVSATNWTDDSSSKVTFPGAGATSPKIQDIHAGPHDSTEQMSDIDCDDGEERDDDTLEGEMLEEGDECDDPLDSENGNVPLTTVSEDEDCEEDFDSSDVKLDGSTPGLEDSEECKDEVEADDSNDTFLDDIARIPVSATSKESPGPKVNVLAVLGHEENELDDLEYCDLDDDFQEEQLPFCDELDDLPSTSPATSTTTSHPPPTQAAPSPTPSQTDTAVPASKALTKKGPDTLPFADSQLSVSQGSSETDIDGTSDASKQVLDYHNQLRAMYGEVPSHVPS